MYILFLDVDGTIINDDLELTKINIDSINKVAGLGHKVFLCTGRSLQEAKEPASLLNIDGMILSQGAHIIVDNKKIHQEHFDVETVLNIVKISKQNEIGIFLESDDLNYYNEFLFNLSALNLNEESIRKFKAFYSLMLPINDLTPFTKINKASFVSKQNPNLIDFSLIETHVDITVFSKSIYHSFSGEISMKHSTKKTGICKVLAYLNMTDATTIGIGDSENDLSMFEIVDIKIAMGNAPKILKEKADYITDHVNNNGVAKAINKLKLDYLD